MKSCIRRVKEAVGLAAGMAKRAEGGEVHDSMESVIVQKGEITVMCPSLVVGSVTWRLVRGDYSQKTPPTY